MPFRVGAKDTEILCICRALLEFTSLVVYQKGGVIRLIAEAKGQSMTLLVDHPEGMRIAIDRPGLGFFAHLTWYIPILTVAGQQNIPVQIASLSRQYVTPERGGDFVDYFFADRLAGHLNMPESVPWTVIKTISQVVPDDDRLQTGFDYANRIFFERYEFRPWVLETIDVLLKDRPKDDRLIGVHYRGTDKDTEAPRVDYAEMLAVIERELARSPNAHIFVATDEVHFLEVCRTRYGGRVLFLKDYVRSRSGQPVHLQPMHDGFRLGRDAVLNCALLSRCDILIKTPSILSGWAKIINPALPAFLMARPYDKFKWFPDRDIPSYPVEGGSHGGAT